MKILIKLTVSGVILVLFYRSMNLELMVANMTRGNMIFLFLALAVYTFGMVIRSWKFAYSMRIFDMNVPLRKALRINYVSLPFNLLLPAGLGEDVSKAILVGQKEEDLKIVVGAVLFDKVTNLISLLILCNVGMIILFWRTGVFLTLMPFLVLVGAVVGAYLGRALVVRRNSLLIRKFTRLYWMLRKVTSQNMGMTFRAMGMAVLMHIVISITSFYTLYQAFPGPHVSYLHFVALVPLVLFLQIVPVFFGGVGAREAGFVYLLGLVGVRSEIAILVPISYYGIILVNISIGLALFLLVPQIEGERSPRRTLEMVKQRIFKKEEVEVQ